MKIYTRTGDRGSTALFGGGRVPKAHPRVSAYGEIDELNAVVGWAAATVADEEIRSRLAVIQPDLFAIGSHLATPPTPEGRRRPVLPSLPTDRVEEFEAWMDQADKELSPLRAFIMPGGSPGAAALHLARTVCRRAERQVVELAESDDVDSSILAYLNRLSDLFFVLARLENRRAGVEDIEWTPAKS